ncbi:unnamed protein product [Eretmochelys imbricata]
MCGCHAWQHCSCYLHLKSAGAKEAAYMQDAGEKSGQRSVEAVVRAGDRDSGDSGLVLGATAVSPRGFEQIAHLIALCLSFPIGEMQMVIVNRPFEHALRSPGLKGAEQVQCIVSYWFIGKALYHCCPVPPFPCVSWSPRSVADDSVQTSMSCSGCHGKRHKRDPSDQLTAGKGAAAKGFLLHF